MKLIPQSVCFTVIFTLLCSGEAGYNLSRAVSVDIRSWIMHAELFPILVGVKTSTFPDIGILTIKQVSTFILLINCILRILVC